MLIWDVPGETWWSYQLLLHGRASRGAEENPTPCGVPQNRVAIVVMQRYEGVQEYFSRVWEAFVVKVVMFGE